MLTCAAQTPQDERDVAHTNIRVHVHDMSHDAHGVNNSQPQDRSVKLPWYWYASTLKLEIEVADVAGRAAVEDVFLNAAGA